LDSIGANSLVAMENPGSYSGSLESFPVQGAFGCHANSVPEAAHQWGTAAMYDVGFLLSSQAIRRQLAAMPHDMYLIRLIHGGTRKPFPGERLWPTAQLLLEPTIRFLRARNRDGFDVYFRPYVRDHNAGYILVDLDDGQPTVLAAMRDNGHEPCAVIETSPGHLQAWIRVSAEPLPPEVATTISRHLAHLYHGDRASADWRHVGRLAGFTNQKPQRRLPSRLPPWVKLQHAAAGLASHSRSLMQTAGLTQCPTISRLSPDPPIFQRAAPPTHIWVYPALAPTEAIAVYQTWLNRLQIPQRFPRPDWSIADLWIAKELLLQGAPTSQVKSILHLASPQFPRAHSDPEDYLRRTLARAAHDITRAPFPARESALPTRSFHSKHQHSSL
jgi:RepB DNA-primase from phage plasmid